MNLLEMYKKLDEESKKELIKLLTTDLNKEILNPDLITMNIKRTTNASSSS